MAFLICTLVRDKWQLRITSEYPITRCGDVNKQQILILKAQGSTFDAARKQIIDMLAQDL